MAKTVCKILGVVFLLVGVCGFVAPHLLGAHLSPAHNVVHLVSGALALYFGFAGTFSAAKMFSLFSAWSISRLVFWEWRSEELPTGCGTSDRWISARPTTVFTSCWA